MARETAMLMFCRSCNKYVPTVPAGEECSECPECGALLMRGHCFRCGHDWVRRNTRELPLVCPKCKSPYWGVPRPTGRRTAGGRDPDMDLYKYIGRGVYMNDLIEAAAVSESTIRRRVGDLIDANMVEIVKEKKGAYIRRKHNGNKDRDC